MRFTNLMIPAALTLGVLSADYAAAAPPPTGKPTSIRVSPVQQNIIATHPGLVGQRIVPPLDKSPRPLFNITFGGNPPRGDMQGRYDRDRDRDEYRHHHDRDFEHRDFDWWRYRSFGFGYGYGFP